MVIILKCYNLSVDIFSGVLVEVIEKCVEGASVRDVCIWADNLIIEETSKVFKKEKEMKKGIALRYFIGIYCDLLSYYC